MHDMNDLYRAVKRAGKMATESGRPADIVYGKIKSLAPLKIQWGTLVLDKDFLVPTARFLYDTEEHQLAVKDNQYGGYVLVPKKIKVGDKVVMLVKPGGQEFLVIDKVVKQ